MYSILEVFENSQITLNEGVVFNYENFMLNWLEKCTGTH